MEACYEYLGCNKENCPVYGKADGKHCWEVEGTLGNHRGIKIMMEELKGETSKEDACLKSACIYYEFAKRP